MIPIKGLIAIQVRMLVRQAQQALVGLRRDLNSLQSSSAKVSTASAAMAASQLRAAKSADTLGNRVKAAGIASMKSASQFQWFSRQLMYNWGIPLVAAGVMATKWSLETEAAMTRVQKVYGDLKMDPNEKKAELDALARFFETASNRYGMLQKDVIGIGATWAAAGAEAVGLAKATQLTIETMILGEMNAADSAKALISIQEAWRQSAVGLKNTIAELNMVENQTAVDMSGLIEAFVRTGSSARIAGLSTGDLAAIIAGLVPAAGNATTAGNSLKTILSRIAAPTKAAENAIKALGYNVDSTSWKSMDARKRLEGMAEAFSKMDRNQQQAIATDIAGRQQYNRFVQVMDALSDKTSAYWTAQEALRKGKEKINGVTGLQIQYEKELNAVLESNPQAMKMVLARLQNLAIKGFAPLIPYIIAVMQYLVKFATWLGNLPPEVKKLIAALLILITAVTLLSKVIAAFWLLAPMAQIFFGTLLNAVGLVGKAFSGLGRVIASPLKLFNVLSVALRSTPALILRSVGPLSALTFGFLGLGRGLAAAKAGGTVAIGMLKSLAAQVAKSAAFLTVVPMVRQFGMTVAFLFKNLGRTVAISWGLMVDALILKITTGLVSLRNVFAATPIVMLVKGMLARIGQLFMGSRIVVAASALMTGIATVFSRGFAVISAMGLKFFLQFRGTILGAAAAQGGLAAIFSNIGARIAAMWLTIRSAVLKGMIFIVSGGTRIISALPGLVAGAFVAMRTKVLAILVAMRAGIIRGFVALPGLIVAGIKKLPGLILQVLRTLGPLLLRIFTGPWGLAIGLVISLIVKFRDQIGQALSGVIKFFSDMWNGIGGQVNGVADLFSKFTQFAINCFYALPREIQTAMQAVVDVVYRAAMAVYQLFSYLNPFARHSPSLVENVVNGMAVISSEFGNISSIQAPIDRAYAHIKKFKDLMASFRNGRGVDLEFAEDLKNIGKINPKALGTARAMVADIKALQKVLDGIEPELRDQNAVVDRWRASLDDANAALDEQQSILDELSTDMDYYESLINSVQKSMDDFANMSITGMIDFEDQIQANTQAQNELKLAMLQMEQAAGGFDSIADKMAALNGEFEKLTASRDELVSAGAGSDVLRYYDEQIAAIEAQKNAIYDSSDAYTEMARNIKELEKQGELLDLTKSVTYDPLTYQIEKLTKSQKEMSFDEIVNGILDAQQTIDDYTPALEAATTAYKEQEAVVYSLTQARNLIQRQYDIESAKLDKIKSRYDAVNDTITDLRQALDQMSMAADKANKSLGKKKLNTGGAGGAGAGGGYPGGGPKTGGKSFGIKDLEKGGVGGINGIIKGMEDAMDALDLTKPIKEKWEAAVGWWNTNIQPAMDLIGRSIATWWASIDWAAIVGDGGWLKSWWDGVSQFFSGLSSDIGSLFGEGGLIRKIFGDDFQTAWDELIKGFQQFGKEIAPGFMEFWESVKPFIDAVGTILGKIVKYILIGLGGAITVVLKLILYVWNSAIQPLLKGLGGILRGVFKIFGGLMDWFTGLVTGDMEKIKSGAAKVLGGLWDIVWNAFRAVALIVINLIGNLFKEAWQLFANFFPDIAKSIQDWWKGLLDAPIIGAIVKGIVSAFQWLYDVLLGHSIIPDIVNGIMGWFKNLASWALGPILILVQGISTAFKWVYDKIKNTPLGQAASDVVGGVKDAFSSAWEWITSPFRRAEGDVKRSFTSIESTVDSSTDNMGDSFDDVFKSFKGMTRDIQKSAKTDWKAIRRAMNKEIEQLPKDQQKTTSKMVKDFLKVAEDIQKKNPALWEKVRDSITKPTGEAAHEVGLDAVDIKKAITGLGDVKIPAQWTGLSRTLSAPTGSAVRSVKSDVNAMNRAIDGLDGGLPKEWKNLRTTIVDPVQDAKSALAKIKFSTSNITAPLGRIASAADRVTSALSRMISKWRSADAALGLKYGGAVSIDKMNGYANTLVPGNATGGAIHGPGGPTSDKVLRYLSSGEHVLTSREVAKLGGQGSVYALRSFIRRNNVSTEELVKAYKSQNGHANGGSILRFGVSTQNALASSMRRMESATVSRAATVEHRTTNIENANFEFPNIRSGKDAKEFLDNLEILTGS